MALFATKMPETFLTERVGPACGERPSNYNPIRIVLTLSLQKLKVDFGGITDMPTQTMSTERRTEKLDVRVSRSAKAKLQAAASASHRSMSDFVMECALSKAEKTLTERRIFAVDTEKCFTFQDALEA